MPYAHRNTPPSTVIRSGKINVWRTIAASIVGFRVYLSHFQLLTIIKFYEKVFFTIMSGCSLYVWCSR